jgi:hypothetical protein
MSFKENLREKIEIDRLARNVGNSLGKPGTERKIDREAMRGLLERTDFSRRDQREMEIYLRDGGSGPSDILVLDNDLPLYHTTLEDVLIRKSPTVKEMISIKNAVKILSDKDVIVSKGEDTLQKVHEQSLSGLDLTFGLPDLREIADEGIQALEAEAAEGVLDALNLFAEILDWTAPPAPLRLSHWRQLGRKAEKPDGSVTFGPCVLFSHSKNALRWIQEPLDSSKKSDAERLNQIAEGEQEPDAEGRKVFDLLVETVRQGKPAGFREGG